MLVVCCFSDNFASFRAFGLLWSQLPAAVVKALHLRASGHRHENGTEIDHLWQALSDSSLWELDGTCRGRIQISMEAFIYWNCPHLLHARVPVPIWCPTCLASSFQQAPWRHNILAAWGPLGFLLLPPRHRLLQASARRQAALSSSRKLACAHLLRKDGARHWSACGSWRGMQNVTCRLRLRRLSLPNPSRPLRRMYSLTIWVVAYCKRPGESFREWLKPIADPRCALLLDAFLRSLVRSHANVVFPKICRDSI